LNCTFGVKYFQHPVVGQLKLSFEAAQLPDDSAHRILMYSATPGTPSQAALRLLLAGVGEPGGYAADPAHREV
jgi:hypothetical protein